MVIHANGSTAQTAGPACSGGGNPRFGGVRRENSRKCEKLMLPACKCRHQQSAHRREAKTPRKCGKCGRKLPVCPVLQMVRLANR